MGPPKNQRSKDLIKWGLQLIGLICVYFSSHFQEATLGLNLVALVLYYLPYKWILKLKGFYMRRFPPKPRLLTNEEYYQQGAIETAKALEELKNYCNSPDCNQWKTMLKLKNPSRFASFIEGESHIQDDELMDYETTIADLTLSDEETSDDEGVQPEIQRSSRQGTPIFQQFNSRSRQISTSTPTNIRGSTPVVQSSTRMTPTLVNRRRQNGTAQARNTPQITNGANGFEFSEDDE